MANTANTSRVLTLVFTDLADSTALKTRQGDSAIEVLISRHAGHVTTLAAECGGRIIDWAGDGCFLTFETSSSAVLFALRLQQAHAEESDLPGVRIGIHMGEVTESTNNAGAPHVAGLAVDLASRISGLARPGQVLMSAAVYDSARQRIGVESLGKPILWQAHGTYTVKGFDKEIEIGEAALEGTARLEAPISGDKAKLVRRPPNRKRRLVALALGATMAITLLGVAYLVGGSRNRGAVPALPIGPITSLAVLPLENLSGDPEQEYFADGMTEAITSELAKIRSLKVIPRASAMKYKKSEKSMPEIAGELGVDGLIDGSVLKDGDQVRITAQLIDGHADAHLWSESYTNSITNVLKLQSDVALAIADAIQAELTGEERTRIAKSQTVDPKAYNAFLLGNRFREQVTPEGVRTAIRYFEEATRLDPQFAEAWAMQGNTYGLLTAFGLAPPEEVYPKAREMFLTAMGIDPDLPDAHTGLATVAFRYDREWEQAEQRFRRALKLDPRYARAHRFYGVYLMQMGRLSEAVEHAETALELDPDEPFSQSAAGGVLGNTGQLDRARTILERLLASRPDFVPTFSALGQAYLDLGSYENAISTFERGVEVSGRSTNQLLWLAVGLAATGQPDRARDTLTEAIEKGDYFDAGVATLAYAALGELDSAFEWMDKSIAAHDAGLAHFRTVPYRKAFLNNPNIVKFRTDPRFWQLMERAKLPPLPPEHPGYAEEQVWLARKRAEADANAPITKIAVLPFTNISGDPQQEYFVDGMTEALISELAKIKSIKVISRTSAMHYKDTDKTAPEIARELGVDGLVEGSAMKAGNEVRITAQLIRGATDEHLWNESYTETLENVLKVQAQVALAITTEIKAVVTPDERNRVNSAKAVNAAAYELYAQARYLLGLRNAQDFQRARLLLERAIEIDPDFALGHSGLADLHYVLADYYLAPSAETYPIAREEAEKALALDPTLGEAYAVLAMLAISENWDWIRSEQLRLKSVELSPNHATGRHWGAIFLSAAGRRDEAVAEMELAFQLDPVSPVIAASLAQFLSGSGRIPEAVELAERTADQHPNNWRVLLGLSSVYVRAGRYQDALEAADRMAAAEGNQSTAAMYRSISLASLRRSDEARKLTDDTAANPEAADGAFVHIARAYMVLGDHERAIEWLTKAVDTRDRFAWRMNVFSEFDPIKEDPRYQALLRRMNFPTLPENQ